MKYNKIFMFLFLGMFLFSLTTVSAAEFDNCGEYDETNQTMVIKNNCVLGLDVPLVTEEIANITLLTPLHNQVPRGYQMVHELRFKNSEVYSNALE